MSDKELAFLLGRLSLGVNFAAHGIVRLPNLHSFCEGMVTQFQNTLIGFDPLIYAYSYLLVWLELFVGIALIIGFKTRASLVVVSMIMMSLIFGASMQEEWPRVGFQMIYVVFTFLLLQGYMNTKYSLDARWR